MSQNKKKILIIDDDQDLRDNVSYVFQPKGYEVKTAVDGIDGLEQLKDFKPDLIILDMNMPRMDGLEFYNKLKGDNDKSPFPVLVLTARANLEDLFKELDVDGFIPKPFEIDHLIQEGESIIQKSAGKICIQGSEEERLAKVCIVDDDEETLQKLSFLFLESGFVVNTAKTGTSAIKRITMDMPDILIMKLKLSDISGDMVILKLKQMEKMEELKFILYTEETAVDASVADKIDSKLKRGELVKSNNPNEILSVAGVLLRSE